WRFFAAQQRRLLAAPEGHRVVAAGQVQGEVAGQAVVEVHGQVIRAGQQGERQFGGGSAAGDGRGSVTCSWFPAITATLTAPLGPAWVSAPVEVVALNAAVNAGTRRCSRASNSPTPLASRSSRLFPKRRLCGDGGKKVGQLRACLRPCPRLLLVE